MKETDQSKLSPEMSDGYAPLKPSAPAQVSPAVNLSPAQLPYPPQPAYVSVPQVGYGQPIMGMPIASVPQLNQPLIGQAEWKPGMQIQILNCMCGYKGPATIEYHLRLDRYRCAWIAGIFLLPITGLILCYELREPVPACPQCKRLHTVGEYRC